MARLDPHEITRSSSGAPAAVHSTHGQHTCADKASLRPAAPFDHMLRPALFAEIQRR
jgi:hypothetical protein